MAPIKSSALAKNAANLAAQLALVESKGREESMGREKTDSRPSTGTAVSAAAESIDDSLPISWAPSQGTTGHTSPTKLEDSSPASWTTSKSTTGHTSPSKLESSSPASWANSKPTTGYKSPTKLENSGPTSWANSKTTTGHSSPTNVEDAQDPADPDSIAEEDADVVDLTGGAVGRENLLRRTSTEKEVRSHSVAEAVEAIEAKAGGKLTRLKKVPK